MQLTGDMWQSQAESEFSTQINGLWTDFAHGIDFKYENCDSFIYSRNWPQFSVEQKVSLSLDLEISLVEDYHGTVCNFLNTLY